MRKVLITGNSGYIGSHLTKLLSENYQVFGLDINDPQITARVHYPLDIRNAEILEILPHFDTVIHLAALVNVGESEVIPTEYYDTNLNGTLNVLQNISTDNFIFASTGAAEKCESAYGISKRAAEDCVREYCLKQNIDYTIFRFYNVIGSDGIKPTNPDGLFFNLLKSQETNEFTIFGNDYDTVDGTCVRDYVHVNEICDALKTAIERPSNQLENLGHGVGSTVLEMVNLFEQVNNLKIDVKFGPRRKGDIEISVLDKPSSYLREIYSLSELLRIKNAWGT